MGAYLYMENAVLLDSHETSRTLVQIWGTQYAVALPHYEERIYVIRTFNKKTSKVYVRFGNRTQAKSILNQYKKEKRFEL